MKSRSSLMLGGAALLLLTATAIFSQEEAKAPVGDVVTKWSEDADPFASDMGFAPFSAKQIRPERAKEKRETMCLRAEVWEVSAVDMVRALDAGISAEALQKWRSGLLEEGTLAFTSILNIDSGDHGTVESITEYIYPTEYEPGEVLPVAEAVEGKTEPEDQTEEVAPTTTPTTPTAFETRNTGTTLEALLKPVEVAEDTWDLLYELEAVMPIGHTELGAPELHITMPVFTTFSVSGLTRLAEGNWQLAASQPAPAGMEKKAEGKSWVTLIRIDRAR